MRSRFVAWLVLGAGILVAGRPAAAQDAPDGFLLKHPVGAIAIRGGLSSATARGDLFAFVTKELTLDRRDFRAAALAVDAGAAISSRLAWTAGFAFGRTATPSEFRDWLDNRRLPIEQTTSLERMGFTGSLRAYLVDPGRGIGRFAWIPARYAPYVGAGGGLMRYSFDQKGDFIDYETLNVFYDAYHSGGIRPMAQAFAGLDVSLSPRLLFTSEARYEWARGPLSADFRGFDPIDLSGVSLTTGIAIRY